jgi:hypothetical protein
LIARAGLVNIYQPGCDSMPSNLRSSGNKVTESSMINQYKRGAAHRL